MKFNFLIFLVITDNNNITILLDPQLINHGIELLENTFNCLQNSIDSIHNNPIDIPKFKTTYINNYIPQTKHTEIYKDLLGDPKKYIKSQIYHGKFEYVYHNLNLLNTDINLYIHEVLTNFNNNLSWNYNYMQSILYTLNNNNIIVYPINNPIVWITQVPYEVYTITNSDQNQENWWLPQRQQIPNTNINIPQRWHDIPLANYERIPAVARNRSQTMRINFGNNLNTGTLYNPSILPNRLGILDIFTLEIQFPGEREYSVEDLPFDINDRTSITRIRGRMGYINTNIELSRNAYISAVNQYDRDQALISWKFHVQVLRFLERLLRYYDIRYTTRYPRQFFEEIQFSNLDSYNNNNI